MKIITAVVLGVVLLGASGSHAAEKVVVMVRTGVEADAIRAVAQAYTKATGRPVEMMEIGRSGYYATLHTQMVAGTDTFDLAQANDVDVGVLAEAKAIAPIGPYLNDPRHTDPKTFDPKDIAFTYSYKGQVYAVPFDVSTHFLYYRKDLFEDPAQRVVASRDHGIAGREAVVVLRPHHPAEAVQAEARPRAAFHARPARH
ncbi:MAG: extracellular solute-binding protein, partial [candidate division NC10 bacterium]